MSSSNESPARNPSQDYDYADSSSSAKKPKLKETSPTDLGYSGSRDSLVIAPETQQETVVKLGNPAWRVDRGAEEVSTASPPIAENEGQVYGGSEREMGSPGIRPPSEDDGGRRNQFGSPELVDNPDGTARWVERKREPAPAPSSGRPSPEDGESDYGRGRRREYTSELVDNPDGTVRWVERKRELELDGEGEEE